MTASKAVTGVEQTTSRRRLLKSVAASAVVAGGTIGTVTARTRTQGSLVSQIASNGHWDINDPPTSGGFFRSDNPFSLTANGERAAVNAERGRAHVLTDVQSGQYADAGFDLHVGPVGDIESVTVVSSGDPVAMNLWLDEGGDGDFFAWQNHRGNTQQLTGLAGDTYKTGGGIGTGSVTIAKDGHTFSGQTIEQWAAEVGASTPAAIWVGVCCRTSKEATVESVDVARA